MQITNISKEDLIDILKQIYRCIPESFPHEKRRNWEQIEHGLRKLIDFFEENAKLTESNDLHTDDLVVNRLEKIREQIQLYLKKSKYSIEANSLALIVQTLIDELQNDIYNDMVETGWHEFPMDELIDESNDLYAGDEKIFDTAELNLMADKIIKRFGDIKDFEEFYPKAFEYADGYISETALADEYGVDEEEIESNYHDYIDAFVETIYDNISN